MKVINLLIVAVGVLFLHGCANETVDVNYDGDDALVRFKVQLPANAAKTGITRGMSDTDESVISTIDVYQFLRIPGTSTDDYSNYVAVDVYPAQGIFNDSSPSWIGAKLLRYPGEDSRLVIVINARAVGNYGYRKGVTLKNFTDALILKDMGEWYTGTPRPLPMYGITGNVDVYDNNILDDNGAPYILMRMHAKFNISQKDPLDNGVFQLVSACVFNRNTHGYIAYDESLFDTTVPAVPQPVAPHIPSTAGTVYLPSTPYYGVGTDNQAADYGKIINKLYLFEVDNASQSDRLKKAALIIGGKYGTDTQTTYYRVDLSSTDGNILRNSQYDMVIVSAYARGYDTPEHAFVGENNLTATITPWNLSTQGVIGDRQYYLTVSRDECRFDYTGGQMDINIETDYDTTLQGYPAGIQVQESEIIYTNGGGWLTLVDTIGENGYLTRTISILAHQNDGNLQRSAKIKVTAGNFTKVINVVQAAMP